MTRYTISPKRFSQPARSSNRLTALRPRGMTSVLVVLFVSVLGVGLLYVNQVNRVTTSGLTVKQLQQQIESLKEDTTEMSLRVEQLRSLSTVEQTSEALKLTQRAQLQYLAETPNTVALGK